MTHIKWLLFALLIFIPCNSLAQWQSAWQQHLHDSLTLASLSIPGAHDAATGEGLIPAVGFGKTQALSLQELWNHGVRAFDLRPAINDTALHIYHGPLKTKVTLAQALAVLTDNLRQHPKEFAIVLLREESESESAQEQQLWPSKMAQSLESLAERAIAFHGNLTVGEARGKLIFLSRTPIPNTTKGATILHWSHAPEGTSSAAIVSNAYGTSTPLCIQDFYAPTSAQKQRTKQAAIAKFVNHGRQQSSSPWTLNFVSGYASTWLGFTSLATTHGYKKNATLMNSYMLQLLHTSSSTSAPLHCGIVFMDYAGVDTVCGNVLHWKPYHVAGRQLVDQIILQNFKHFSPQQRDFLTK